MTSLTLTDVPPILLHRLRVAAERDRRSLAQEILVLVERGLDASDTADERATRRVAAWTSLAGTWQSTESIEQEVDAIVESRTPGSAT